MLQSVDDPAVQLAVWWLFGLANLGAGGVTGFLVARILRAKDAAAGAAAQSSKASAGGDRDGAAARDHEAADDTPADDIDFDAVLARRVLGEFCDVAKGLSHDMDRHGDQITSIGDQLQRARSGHQDAMELAVVQAIGSIVEANAWLQRQLTGAQETIQQQARQLERQLNEALTDPLTGIPNRRAFERELARSFAAWRRHRTVFALVLFDVDRFKDFNDRHGHQAGDVVLHDVGAVIASALREIDFTARYGGEEFAAILPQTDLANAEYVAQRVRRAMAAHVIAYGDRGFRITISCGVTEVQPGDDAAALIERADRGLYLSKECGRNRTTVHDGENCRTLPTDRAHDESAATDQAEQGSAVEGAARVPPSEAAMSELRTRTRFSPLDRQSYCEAVRVSLEQGRVCDRDVAVILVEIDDGQTLSQAGRFAAWDHLMHVLAAEMSEALPNATAIGLYCSERVGVLLSDCTLGEATAASEVARRAVAAAPAVQSQTSGRDLTLSVGVAASLVDDDWMSLVQRAEGALQAARAHGGDATYFKNHRREQARPAPLVEASVDQPI